MGHKNNSDALEATYTKWKIENNSIWVNFNSFIFIKSKFSSWVIFNLKKNDK